MLFKRAIFFPLEQKLSFHKQAIHDSLAKLAFSPCPPSFAKMSGFVSPLPESPDALVHMVGHYMLFCMQIEEKILPATVIKQHLDEKIQAIQAAEQRKVYQKEKHTLRDEITLTLLPKAFSKFSQIYAYIDTQQNILVVNTTEQNKIKQLANLLKKSLEISLKPFKLKKISYLLSQWLMHEDWPEALDVLQHAVLQDPQNTKRVLRCQQQDLFSQAIKSFLKEGQEVKSIKLRFHQGIDFTLTDQLLLNQISYHEDLLAQQTEGMSETKAEQFDTQFILSAEILGSLIPILLGQLTEQEP